MPKIPSALPPSMLHVIPLLSASVKLKAVPTVVLFAASSARLAVVGPLTTGASFTGVMVKLKFSSALVSVPSVIVKPNPSDRVSLPSCIYFRYPLLISACVNVPVVARISPPSAILLRLVSRKRVPCATSAVSTVYVTVSLSASLASSSDAVIVIIPDSLTFPPVLISSVGAVLAVSVTRISNVLSAELPLRSSALTVIVNGPAVPGAVPVICPAPSTFNQESPESFV